MDEKPDKSCFKNTYEDELLLDKGKSAPIYLFKDQLREFTLKHSDSSEAKFVKIRINQKFQFYKSFMKGQSMSMKK